MVFLLNLPTVERGYFTAGNCMVQSKTLADYFATSDYAQHSKWCIELLDVIPPTATIEGANFTLETFYDLIIVYYASVEYL